VAEHVGLGLQELLHLLAKGQDPQRQPAPILLAQARGHELGVQLAALVAQAPQPNPQRQQLGRVGVGGGRWGVGR
jgi:hypothetical protein